MTRRRPGIIAAAVLGAAAIVLPGTAVAQGTILSIQIRGQNTNPIRPTAPINNLQELMQAFARCWSPPPVDTSRQPIDLTFQVSFKRSGELFGKPRAIQFAREITPEERERYYQAVAEAVERCSQMPFTDQMGGAVAGQTFRVNFIDARNRKQAEVSWLITKID
ncbi:MAG: hypothetical protein V7604_663 [Hyphomicrobiales bacterium]